MALLVFTPPVPPSPGTGNQPEVKLLEAEFGDGYTQSAPDGINHIRRVLNLKWEMLSPAQCDQIVAFLTARGGSEPFLYTPSDELTPVKWTCKKWGDERLKNGLRSVNAEFRQSFLLA